MTDALFTIEADSTDQGFDANNSQVLNLRLKTLPPSGVNSVVYQVFNPGAFDPTESIAANPPRQSTGAPTLVLDNLTTTGQSIAPAPALDSNVQVTMPATGSHSWIVRCVVNGGLQVLADGRSVPDPALIHERMIVIRDSGSGSRKVVSTETTQYHDDGWAEAFGAGGSVATGSEPGYLSRTVYVNGSSSKVSTSYAGETVEAAPASWATDADIPDGNQFDVVCAGGGGGGSGGAVGLGFGPSGGGGCWHARRFSRAELVAALPISLTIGLGGPGGAGTDGVGTPTQNGTVGASALFGNLLAAFGGAGGGQPGSSSRSCAPGGGSLSAGQTVGTSTGGGLIGGLPGGLGTGTGTGGAGGEHPNTGARCADDGGGSGASLGSSSGSDGDPGGRSVRGGGGGGSGSNINTSTTGRVGGDGGASGGVPDGTEVGGGGAGGAVGSAGTAGADGAGDHAGDGGGGGGTDDGTVSVGGDGGAGGFPSGGGGGAGGGRGDFGGDGGDGGDPMIMITAFA